MTRSASPASPARRGTSARRLPAPTSAARYLILVGYCLVAVIPIFFVVMNSFKTREAIFGNPLSLPIGDAFTLSGYEKVLTGPFLHAIWNSLIVTGVSVASVLVLGSMAAFAYAMYLFPGRQTISLYLLIGILLPTTLGTVITLQMIVSLGLHNNLLGLILVYTGQAIPLSFLILGEFLRQVPREITDAARVDGAGEFRVYRIAIPLIRPALGAVGILTLIPVWNDLWWPLILAPARDSQTLILFTQQFQGQYRTDFSALLASLTMAMVPVLTIFALFSRQLIRGLTSGAVK